jgi:hypothetical protein
MTKVTLLEILKRLDMNIAEAEKHLQALKDQKARYLEMLAKEGGSNG